jgi:hypothetical protein
MALTRLGWFRAESGKIFSGGAHRPMMTNMDYEHLVALLRRPWFRRTWIIQEVATSERASVHCGKQTIPWETLANVYMGLGKRFLPVQQVGGNDAQHLLESITAIENARRSHRGSLSMSLYDILVATTQNQCRDDHDKVFAVVGLAKDWRGQASLLPGYHSTRDEQTALETFKAFAVVDVMRLKNLRILSCASGPKESTASLSSWVPDWRYVNNSHPFTRYSDRSKFRASGATQPEAWFSANNTILHVLGKRVDQVHMVVHETTFAKTIGVFEITKQKISDIEQSHRWLQKCHELSRDGRGRISASRFKEFCRTLICGLTSEAFRASAKYSQYVAKYLAFLSRATEIFREYLEEASGFGFGARGLDEFDPHVKTHALVEGCLDRWASKRKFSVTSKGRLTSIPAKSKEGDIICVLFGGEVPFVLRRLADGYHAVVGECYVDGIMDGECFSDDVPGPQEFRLK